MKNFKSLKIAILVALISFCLPSCDIAYSYGLPKKIGDAEVTFKGEEIFVKNFPHYTKGVVGLNEISFGNFSFDELDEYIYKMAKKSSLIYMNITIQYLDIDSYGKKTEGKRITIGKIDVNDTKKFANFSLWKNKYSTANMYWKDKETYDCILKEMNNTNFFPAYEPKDIRNTVPWNMEDMEKRYYRLQVEIADKIRTADSIAAENALLGNPNNAVYKEGRPGLVCNVKIRFLKDKMDKIIVKLLGQNYIETEEQFNYVCEQSGEFYKLINEYIEQTGINPYKN